MNLESLFNWMEKSSVKIGLRVNEEKTKYMIVRRQDNASSNPSLSIGIYDYSRVDHFKYLGTILTKSNETTI